MSLRPEETHYIVVNRQQNIYFGAENTLGLQTSPPVSNTVQIQNSVELIQYQYLSITIGTAQMRGTDITEKKAVSIHANLNDTYPYQTFSEQVAS